MKEHEDHQHIHQKKQLNMNVVKDDNSFKKTHKKMKITRLTLMNTCNMIEILNITYFIFVPEFSLNLFYKSNNSIFMQIIYT